MHKIKTPYFLSAKLVYFDSSFIKKEGGDTFFKIGKVCEEIGCVGQFSKTGAKQISWWLLENKIIINFITPNPSGGFYSELKVWRYDHVKRKFILIL